MYQSRRDWKPIPYTAEERAELARWNEEAARQEAEELAREDAIRAALHPAFQAVAAHIAKEANREIGIGAPLNFAVTNDECVAFVLEQVTKIGKRAAETIKPELRAIYKDIRERGGDAYAEHKARLQQVSK